MGSLDSAFGVGREDLTANREGRLGPRQRTALATIGDEVAARRRPMLRTGVVLIVAGLAAAAAALSFGGGPSGVVGAAGGVAVVVGISFAGSARALGREPEVVRRLLEAPVECAEGAVRLEKRHDRFVGTRHIVVVDGMSFHVLPHQQAAFAPARCHRVYFVRDRGARRVVAAERCPDDYAGGA